MDMRDRIYQLGGEYMDHRDRIYQLSEEYTDMRDRATEYSKLMAIMWIVTSLDNMRDTICETYGDNEARQQYSSHGECLQ